MVYDNNSISSNHILSWL